MSDKVVVAIITTVGTLLVALIGAIVHWRKNHSPDQEIIPSPQPRKTQVQPFIEKPKPAPEPEPVPTPRRSTALTHKEIALALEAVPPLQRDSVEASFVGLYVTWQGNLFSAFKQRDETSIMIDGPDIRDGLIHCRAKHSDCTDLLVALKGTKLTVRGRITTIGTHEAGLDDCTFEIIKTVSSAPAQV